ncbi:substrate-binding domain-containing protein [Rhizobium leucaenae]|uniref:Simple sugar transport system substrate-binding protein n=1 Tax=Rhizobium leucaenae TaxID=29450 RepID=A0A7W6ZZ33_9HYPH|nr:substrate-binding domain-containing protein [Rhizobium leucaenae]MBB4571404.1 simple sugar transport system substrate-binding protein [Rhizobium leucaenae]
MFKKLAFVSILLAIVFGFESAAIAEPTFIMVTHSPASDSYWLGVIKGLEQAAKDLGVTVQYRGIEKNLNDPNQQRRNLEAAIAAKPDGIIVSDPTPTSLNATIKKASDAGIPVIIVNQGGDQVASVGALAFVGDDPGTQGALAAAQFNALGAKHALIITAPVGALSFLDARTNEFKKAFTGTSTLAEIPLTDFNNSTRIKTIAETQLEKDNSIDAVFSIGGCCIAAMTQVRADLGDRGKGMHWGTIDVTEGAAKSLQAHELDFALDAQQYAQGYYPVVMLALYIRQGIQPAETVLTTGPIVITPKNVERFHASDR